MTKTILVEKTFILSERIFIFMDKNHKFFYKFLTIIIILLFVLNSSIVFADPPADPTVPDQNPVVAPPQTPPDNTQSPEEISQKQAEIEKIVVDINNLDRELEIAIETYNAVRIELEKTEQNINYAQIKIEQAQAEFESRKSIFDERLKNIYKNGSVNILEVILNTKSFSDFLLRMYFLAMISQQDSDLLLDLQTSKKEIEKNKSELEVTKAQQIIIQQELLARKSLIEAKLGERTQFLQSISADLTDTLKQRLSTNPQETAVLLEEAQKQLASLNKDTSSNIVSTALQYLGVPYLWGGETPDGFDCSGLTKYVFAKYNVKLPHYSAAQATLGIPVGFEGVSLKPGDLVFFGAPIHHVGIYIGGDLYIHAPKTGDVVKISRLSERADFVGARRYLLLEQ
ncbi:MAG: C40 family peptidase [Actinobacteria bacterium]|nr:C40 family peptidase [Actinomycetota bacterium]